MRVIELTLGLYAGIVSAALGQAVAAGVLAPDAPGRRLIAADDRTARALARYLAWSTQALGWFLILLAAGRAIAVPDSLTVATKMVFALATVGLLLYLLWSTRPDPSDIPSQPAAPLVASLRVLTVSPVFARNSAARSSKYCQSSFISSDSTRLS